MAESSSLYVGDTKIQLVNLIVSSNMYYTSVNTPADSFGNDGDIYFVKGD